VYAVDVDAADAGADVALAVLHIDGMVGAGVGILGPLAPSIAPPAESC
jgi:hypothetical protein